MRPQSRLLALARISLAVSVTVLATAACQQAPLTGSMPSAPAVAQAGTAQISVVPQWGRQVASVGPYGVGDVAHMRVEIYSLDGQVETSVTSVDLQRGELNGPYLFTGLHMDTTYRVRAIAYNAGEAVISVASQSFIDVVVAQDDAPAIANLAVRLLDHVRPTVGTFTGGTDLTPNDAGFQDGPAADARFANDGGNMTFDRDGNLLLADVWNRKIRKIDPTTGAVSTFAGNDNPSGYADGPAADAQFGNIRGVAVGSDGTTYFSDEGCHCIRTIAEDGTVGTLTGTDYPAGDRYGFVDGPLAAAKFYLPGDLAIFEDKLYVRDLQQNIRKIDLTAGTVSVMGFSGYPITVNAAGDLLIAYGSSVFVVKANGDYSTLAGVGGAYKDGDAGQASFDTLSGIAVDPAGNIYVSEYGNRTIRRVDASGNVLTLAGGNGLTTSPPGFLNGPGGVAQFKRPGALAFLPGLNKLVVKDDGDSTASIRFVQ